MSLVGAGRKAVVDGLLEIYDSLSDASGNSQSCLISLEAPSGWGKTYLVHEFYRQLVLREPKSTRYWPSTIAETYNVDSSDITAQRKRSHPNPDNFNRAPLALPSFFWWGISCDLNSSKDIASNLYANMRQLKQHAPFLEMAWSAAKATRAGKYATLQNARAVASRLLQEGAAEAIDAAVQKILGLTIPGLGLAVELSRFTFKEVNDIRNTNQSLRDGGALPGINEDKDLIDSAVSLLGRLAVPGLPCVLFVEDLHRSNNAVRELISNLLKWNSPIMIITTTWPGEFEKIDSLFRDLGKSWIKNRFYRLHSEKGTSLNFPRKDASLEQLSTGDLENIILERYPEAEAQTAKRLAHRYSNPLALSLALSLRTYQQGWPELTLPEEEINRLPRQIRKLYNELWDELPEDIQKTLALVTHAIPSEDSEWLSNFVTQSLTEIEPVNGSQVIAHVLHEDQIPHGWTRPVVGWLRKFSEQDQLEIAKDAAYEFFTSSEVEEFLRSLADRIKVFNYKDKVQTDDELIHQAWLTITLFDLGYIQKSDVCEAAFWLMARLQAEPINAKTTIALMRRAIDEEWSANPEDLLLLKQHYSRQLFNDGKLEESLELLKEVSDQFISVFGEKNARSLSLREDLAYAYMHLGVNSRAIEEFKNILKNADELGEVDSFIVIRVRNMIAELYLRLEKVEIAKVEFKRLHEDLRAQFGDSHLATLRAYMGHALSLGASGNPKDAVGRLRAIEILLARNGHDSSTFIVTLRGHLAHFTGLSGNPEGAINLYQDLGEHLLEKLGARHPHTLQNTSNLGHWLNQAGKTKEALQLLDRLVNVQMSHISKTAPICLTARNNYANCLEKIEGLDKALQHYQSIYEDMSSVLEPDHPNLLSIRSNIALNTYKGGDPEQGMALLEALSADAIRQLGRRHKLSMDVRAELAFRLPDHGRGNEALAVYEELTEDLINVYDEGAEIVHINQLNICKLKSELGKIEEAIQGYSELIKLWSKLFARNYPQLLSARLSLARLKVRNEEFKIAKDMYLQLYRDVIEMLGSDHSTTIMIKEEYEACPDQSE